MDFTTPSTLLAEQTQKGFSFEVILWLAVLVAACVLLAVAALAIKKRLFGGADTSSPVGFTLADLRRLHAQGQLSDEELAAAEARTLARSRSHYLGDETAGGSAEQAEEHPRPHASSTNDPPNRGPGAENRGDNPDKNGGGGPG
ncbi:MAG: hypothetical protein ACE37H_17270 [Phycisphaeraceae bacterium]